MVKYLRKYIYGKKQIAFYIVTILCVVLSLVNLVNHMFVYALSIAVNSLAGITLFISCILCYDSIGKWKKETIMPFIQKNAFAHRFMHDYGFSTIIMTLPGTLINIVFAVTNALMGIYMRSPWAGSLAAYYMCLSFMRVIVLFYSKHLLFKGKYKAVSKKAKLKLQKKCGAILIMLSIALMGAVIMLLSGRGGKQYAPILTIAIAAYTFYKLAMSIINMVKARKNHNPLIMILRNIGHADALVSLLYLQTALFFAFGGEQKMQVTMNGITGICVIIATIALGITMMIDANKQQTEE